MKPVLVGIGEILWDMVPEGKRLGGAPANVAYHFQQLGGKGIIVSAVGADDWGRELMEQLQALSLSREYIVVDKRHRTGVVSIKVDDKGIPVYDIQKSVAWDFIPSTSQLSKLARKTEAVVFGTLAQRFSLSRQTIRRFVSEVQASAWCILDINLRYPFYNREIIEASLPLAHILKMNDEELSVLAGMLSLEGSEEALLAQLLKRYKLSLIALTKGAKGSVLYSENERFFHPGYPTKVADTVGAGDAFTAMMAMGMLKGHTLDTISDNANKLAAWVCSIPGATPLPSEAIQAVMRER